MNTSEIPRRAPADYWSSVPIATTRRASIFRAPTRVERPSFTFPIKLAGRRETSWSRLGRRSVKLERSRRRRRRSGGGEAHDDGSTVDEPSFSGEKKRRVSRKQHHDPSIPRSFDPSIYRLATGRRSTSSPIRESYRSLENRSFLHFRRQAKFTRCVVRRNVNVFSLHVWGASLSFPLELRARISFRRCYG